MANFDMRGQRVTNQYNAGRDMNFGAIQTPADLVTAFEQLNEQFTQAKEAGVLSEETATDAQYQITKATQQAKNPDPDKKTILDHLTTATSRSTLNTMLSISRFSSSPSRSRRNSGNRTARGCSTGSRRSGSMGS